EKYRNLIDNSNDIVITADVSGNWTFLSPSVKRILGYEPEEMVGRSAFDFMFPEDIASTREAHESVVREGRRFWEYENRWISKDGKVVTLSWNVVALRDEQGNIIGTQGVGRDITERKRMEEALRESEERYRLLSENSLTGIAINMDRRYVYANPRMEEILGYPRGGLVGVEALDTVHPDDRGIFEERMKRGLKGEHLPTPYMHRRLRRDGEPIWVESRSVSINYQNRPAILVNLIDITERKRMEEELRRYSEHLEEMVEERSRKLRDAEQLATIGELAGMVGHDLRNPLQTIVNAIYLAKEKLKSMPSSRAEKLGLEELFGTIKKQMDYMNKIVSDLQDYARPLEPKLVETDLRRLIDDTLSTIAVPEAVEVSVLIEEGFPRLMVDPALMRRVFTNLVTNALQAMPDGGRLTITALKAGDDAFISVRDTGVGIPEENLDRIFQPLFTTKSRGTGFGLSVCRRLVEAHGGSITVESRVGRGSTFTVKIPLRGTPLRRKTGQGREEKHPDRRR
ncbi:MAG: PAS domain S-box protein, partial [Candidatus Geothermarchaeales archaeon]